MPRVHQSLSQHLSLKNPRLNVSNCESGANTKSGKIPWDLPRQILDWEDFEYQSLDSIYNGALGSILQHQFNFDKPARLHRPRRDIHSEDAMTNVVAYWNQTIVTNSLKAAQKHFGTDLPHEEICMCGGQQAQPPSLPNSTPPDAKGKKHNHKHRNPDWAGSKPSTVNPNETKKKAKKTCKAKNLLPGDTKVSPKWKSASITKGEVNKAEVKNKNDFQPIGQIYTYCVRLNARYGYIITDKELVAVRIRPLPQADPSPEKVNKNTEGQSKDEYRELKSKITVSSQELEDFVEGAPEATRALTDGVMEYKVIPWDSHIPEPQKNSGVMTVNLALWWLHMMAAESSAIKEDYDNLANAIWDTDPGKKTPAYDVDESDSQGTSFNSQNYITSFQSELGGRKRAREDDEVAEMPQMTSSAKRPTWVRN